MLTCLSVSSHARLSCRRDVCRQQTHLPAVIGACAVAAPDTVRHEVKALNKQASGRWSDHMLEAAGSLQVVIAPAAADDQQDSRWPALKQPDERKPSAGVRWSHLHSRLLDSLRRQPDLLPQGSRVLVAVSGGQDSMALLRLLIDLQRESSKGKTAPWPLQLVVGHCDHNMRADSAQNAAFVRDQTLRMGSFLQFRRVAAAGVQQHSMQIGVSEQFDTSDADMSMVAPWVYSNLQEIFSSQQQQEEGQQQGQRSSHLQDLLSSCQQQQGSKQQQVQLERSQDSQLQDLQQSQQTQRRSRQHVVAGAFTLEAPFKQKRQLQKRHKGGQTRLQQNADSARMEDFVHQAADKLGLQYIARTAKQELRSEADARDWRHQMLAAMATEAQCTHIVLGHTATDRAETLLFNLIRGAGPSGLSSMGWSRQLNDEGLQLVRPLLDFTREETAEACRITRTEVYEDTTNSDDQYSRNRLRLRVFPHLTAINPAAVQHMAQTSELLQADSSFLDSLAQHHMQRALLRCMLLKRTAATSSSKQGTVEQHVAQHSAAAEQQAFVLSSVTDSEAILQLRESTQQPTYVALSVEQLLQAPRALRHRVIHSWLQQQKVSASPSYRMVHEVQGLLHHTRVNTPCRTSTLCREHCVVRHCGLLLYLHNSTAANLMSGRLGVASCDDQWQQARPQLHQMLRHLLTPVENSGVKNCTATFAGQSVQQQQQQQQDQQQHPLNGFCSGLPSIGAGRRRRRATNSVDASSSISITITRSIRRSITRS